jgi:hypothetical protein
VREAVLGQSVWPQETGDLHFHREAELTFPKMTGLAVGRVRDKGTIGETGREIGIPKITLNDPQCIKVSLSVLDGIKLEDLCCRGGATARPDGAEGGMTPEAPGWCKTGGGRP